VTTSPQTEESIFAEALEQATPEARSAYLDAACGNNAALRRRVENLLQSHAGAASFLQSPVVETLDPAPRERPGDVIGPYKLLQQIGEGGMGIVYMAEQESPVRRRVALKIIKPGMDSRQVIARFEAERQALAMMDHQNIAKVLDAGTTEGAADRETGVKGRTAATERFGRPYFVMELVHGVPITKFCDDSRLTLRQRLELFVPVCQAIQHAHQKGVIHRDIKPSNVLVTMYDDKPVPKVIDFGVAKAIEQRLTEKTLFTQYGTLVGTFEYMSPEQAEMNAFGVDTRSDVYSLGVLLYELLTGTTPLERPKIREAALHEVVRLIKEEEPPRPSVRLSTSGELPKIAAACRAEPSRLSQLVRGELDWIVMKCLEKDRTRRYETVNGLSRDVQRFLADEPVEACPPSLTYRTRKFARKHRGLLTTAAAFVALLAIGLMVTAVLAVWALDAERKAQAARGDAEASLARERIARQEAVAASQRAESYARRLEAATRVLNEGAESQYRGNLAEAHASFARAEEIEPGLHSIYSQRATLYTHLGLWDRAAEDYNRRFRLAPRASSQTCYEHAILSFFVGDMPAYREARRNLLQFRDSSQMMHQAHLVRALVLSPETLQDAADLTRRTEHILAGKYAPWNLQTAGLVQLRAGNFENAAARFREAIALGAGSSNGLHRVTYIPLAMAEHRMGRTAEAEKSLAAAEEAISEWSKAIAEGRLGAMPIDWREWLECRVYYREAKSLIAGAPPPDDPRLVLAHERALAAITHGDAHTFMEEGRGHVRREAWDEAAASFSETLDRLPIEFRPSSQAMQMCVEMARHPEVFVRLANLRPGDGRIWFARGRDSMRQRRWAEAAADYERSLSRSGASGRAHTLHELALLRLMAGDEIGYRELCTMVTREHGPTEDPISAAAFSRICTLRPDAVSDWTIPLDLAKSATAKQPLVPWYQFAAGAAYYRAGLYAEAIERLEESLRVQPAWKGRGQNYLLLAMACRRLGRHDDAARRLAQANAWLEETNRALENNEFGFATSAYLSDWLTVLVLLPEFEAQLTTDRNAEAIDARH
jgi:eukaryotic-like serine/threonine-protein kinase